MSSERDIDELKSLALEHVIPHFANNAMLRTTGPRIFDRGEGCYLYDIHGKRYLDTFASLLTTICGHHRPEVAEAITRQMQRLEFFPNYEDAYTVPLIELAHKLSQVTPGDLNASFFVNSGSEANETALKIARQFHVHNGQPKRYKVIAREASYHGTTLGGISATGLNWFREYFDPLIPGCFFAPPARRNDGGAALRALREIVEREDPRTISAIIMDPIPGSNTGYPLPPDDYLPAVRALCDQHGIMLIFDEVQTGFGKTGKWFACDHWNVVPDILTLGKGFSGGYVPLGAAVVRKHIADSFRERGRELRSGSTYGGHTIACAATLANIGIIERDGLVERARQMGDYCGAQLERLYRHKIVGDCRGIGLLRAVELKLGPSNPPIGNFIRDWCYDHGLILRANGPILVIAPALIITREQIDVIVDHLDQAIAAAMKHFGL
jgi:adenosylmethionine-8-amino-7-oxononanoate aminotransferase